ncbi:MAG TPA: NUDIX hydrolase, partial [Burkholderiaceae bacterium]|nr:NUDIX hydrolase [Burkholderiaceae bacterium]
VSPLGPIEAGGGADYGFRVVVPRAAFEAGVKAMARAVDYPSYKDHVAVTKRGGRARVYHMVWTILRKLQRP